MTTASRMPLSRLKLLLSVRIISSLTLPLGHSSMQARHPNRDRRTEDTPLNEQLLRMGDAHGFASPWGTSRRGGAMGGRRVISRCTFELRDATVDGQATCASAEAPTSDLGVDAMGSRVYSSPMPTAARLAEYRRIDPAFGTLARKGLIARH